jgi:hypothetical protein
MAVQTPAARSSITSVARARLRSTRSSASETPQAATSSLSPARRHSWIASASFAASSGRGAAASGPRPFRQRRRKRRRLARRVREQEGRRLGALLQRRADGDRVGTGERETEHDDVRAVAPERVQRGERVAQRGDAEAAQRQRVELRALAGRELPHDQDSNCRLVCRRLHGRLIGRRGARLNAVRPTVGWPRSGQARTARKRSRT